MAEEHKKPDLAFIQDATYLKFVHTTLQHLTVKDLKFNFTVDSCFLFGITNLIDQLKIYIKLLSN